MDKMNPEHLVTPDNKQAIKDIYGHIKRTYESSIIEEAPTDLRRDNLSFNSDNNCIV